MSVTKIKGLFDLSTRKGRATFYQSRRWAALRHLHLLHHPLCHICGKADPPVLTPATLVDHRVDVADAPELYMMPSNLQSLCEGCHAKKTTDRQYEKYKLKNRRWNI